MNWLLRRGKVTTVFVLGFIFLLLGTATVQGSSVLTRIQWTSNGIDIKTEFSSGFLDDDYLWYTWINAGSIQLLYFVGVDRQYNHYFPSFNFVGQHFYAEDGTELFIGHMLLLYEIFDDANQNGILDADFSSHVYETRYYLDLNISETFIPQSVQKHLVNGSWHYNWRLRYENVWGFLKFPEGPEPILGDTAGLIWLEFLETGYDYFFIDNSSYLKTSLALGPVTQIESFDDSITLTNLGVTALYSTILLANYDVTRVLVESSEYDSHLSYPTIQMDNATIVGLSTGYYSLLFEENYTLYTDPPQSYYAHSAACPTISVNPIIHEIQYQTPTIIFQRFFPEFLPLISNLTIPTEYNFLDTDLLYRVNYNPWDGNALNHDPLHIAHFNGTLSITPTPPIPGFPIDAIVLGLVITLSTIIVYRIRRRH